MSTENPASLIDAYFTELVATLPGVRTADVESIHRARVLTRRLREALPLAADEVRERGTTLARTTGRALGAVRELDVLDAMLMALGTRARFASAVLADLRRTVAEEQREARRRMLKVVESFDPAKPHRAFSASRDSRAHRLWASILRQRIGTRAEAAHEALSEANTFYLPARSHAARVAIKKLRYATEIAEETGLWRPRHLSKDLRRAQALLGEIHDLQVVTDRLDIAKSDDAEHVREIEWLLDLLHSDIEGRHARFLEALSQLCGAADAAARWASGASRRRRIAGSLPVMATLALVVPSFIALAGERRRISEPGRHDGPDCVAPIAPAM
jgi:CHAD domain-containing protein